VVTAKTWKNGFSNGLKTSFVLLKVIIPVFIAIKILEHTPIIGWVSKLCDPLMGFIGLPGEAALAVVTGMFLNFYAVIGIIMALDLTAWQITIVAVILCCCHELVIETAIIKKTGIRVWPIMAVRLSSAIAAGAGLNLIGKLML
jgi:hypothetical protein